MTLHYRPQKKFYKLSRTFAFFMGCGIAVVCSLIIYILGLYFLSSEHPDHIPFIKADHSQAIKIKPDQNLNPRLPHADKMIYNEIDNHAMPHDRATQSMLELPEDPIIQEEVLPIMGSNNDLNENSVSE